MRYIKTNSKAIPAAFLADKISRKLKNGQTVSLFLSGGSSAAVAARLSHLLQDNRSVKESLSDLAVTLADERYGEPGHLHSNWGLLRDAGFDLSAARLFPVLTGVEPAQTTENYGRTAESLLKADYKVALLGMGADGHTAGILPASPAASSKKLVCYYQAADYPRLTLTPKALSELDEAVVFAAGEAKRTALDDLESDLSVKRQPAQILKRIPLVSIYNDWKGEET